MFYMVQSLSNIIYKVTLVFCILISLGCTVKPDDLSGNTPIEDILKLAEQAKGRKIFAEAGDFFMEVDRLHPYSDEGRFALIEAMKSYHDGSDLPSARLAAKRYLTLYPGGPNAPFARYMVGLSFFDAIVDVQRDQGAALHAVREFRKLIQDYPESIYSKRALEKLDIAYSQLAGQEMSVGRYYMKREDYLAAINRFSTVVSKYSDTIFEVEALYRLTESYLALGLASTAKENNILLTKKYPNSEWSLKSRELINQIN
jgi:outer membrane protein assembly factor BamD